MTAAEARPVALITGGAGGIGEAIARILLRRGMRVALCDVTPALDWRAGVRSLLDQPGVSSHTLDVRDAASCRQAVQEAVDHHGGLDILVNNAGIMIRRSALETSETDWDRILDVNLTGALRMAQGAFPFLRTSSSPCVVNIVSTHALRPAENVAAYAVSKAGLAQLTRILALEWASGGIRVNGVAPSIVDTAMTADLKSSPGEFDKRVARIPLGRAIRPEDVAEAVAYLVSPAAAMITGEILLLDGGELIGRSRPSPRLTS